MTDYGWRPKNTNYLGRRLETGLFHVLYSMVCGNELPRLFAYLIIFLDDIELISFSFTPKLYAQMPKWAPYVTNPLSYRPDEHRAFVVLIVITLVVVLLAVVCALKVGLSFQKGKFAGFSLLALKTLRIVTLLIGSILFIPMAEILLTAVACFGPDRSLLQYPQVQCFTGPYSAATIVAIIGLVVFIPYNIVMSSVYIDISPKRTTPTARSPIGRVDTLYLIGKLGVVFSHTLTSDPKILLGVYIPVNVVLVILIMRYEPFYVPFLNRMRSGVWCASTFASMVGLISYLYVQPTTGNKRVERDANYGFEAAAVVSVPLGFLFGYWASGYIRRRKVERVYDLLQLQHKSFGQPLPGSLPARGLQILQTGEVKDEMDEERNQKSLMDDLKTIAKTRTRPKLIVLFSHEGEVEIACRFVHNNRTDQALMIMEEIFLEGFKQFPKSALLALMYAQYLEAYASSANNEDPEAFVSKAKLLKPPFDVRFFLFYQDRVYEQSKQTEGLNSSTLNISSYVEFQTMQNGARQYHLATLIELRSFMAHIRSAQRGKDPQTYPVFVQRISESEQKATEYYKRLIERWPRSKVLLRMYASFLLQVKNDKERAEKYMSLANDIEEFETREMTSHMFARTSVNHSYALDDDTRSLPSTCRGLASSGGPLRSSDDSHNEERRPSILMSSKPSTPPASRKRGAKYRRSLLGTEAVILDDNKDEEENEDDRVAFDVSEDVKNIYLLNEEKHRAPPSESVGSAKSLDREAKQKAYNKAQLLSRLQTPVQQLNTKQQIGALLYIALVIATFALGIHSFTTAERTMTSFSFATRLSQRAVLMTENVRSMQLYGLNDAANVAADRPPSFVEIMEKVKEEMKEIYDEFATKFLPFLAEFYNDERKYELIISRFPSQTKKLMRMNAYDAARYIVLYGGPLVDMAVADWRGDSLANNHVRFFLDNTIVFGPLFEESADRGGKAWANATTEKMHVLYALLAVLVVLLLSWGLLLFRPMLRNTTEEQVRALRMFAMIPKKSLMRILTDLEETIETMSDEISETDADKTANTRSNGRRARHVMSPSFGKEAYLNRSPTRRHKLRYLGGLLLVALPAIALVSAPIVQTSTSIAFAETMTFTNSRRYLAQAVRMLGVETFFHDPTTWGPGQEAMYYRDRLTRLEEVHLAAITGQGCISTSSVLEFYELTKIEAPCAQEVCGNQKMGLDNQIDAFADSAEQYYQYVALAWSEDHTDAERYAIMLGGSETITWMREMVREIVRNLNTLDDLFLKIICDGNNMVRKLAIGLFVVSLLAFTGVYILFLTRTSRARLIEMESTATLVFGIPEDVAAQVPEIQRFIASGGMFSSQN